MLRAHGFTGASALVILIVVFTILSPNFLTLESVTSMFTLSAELGIVAIGASFLMISGEFDLSVGSVFALATFMFTKMADNGLMPVVAFILTMLAVAFMGWMNGIVTVGLRIPSFITTLGTMMLWRGILLYATGGFPIVYEANRAFLEVLGGKIILMLRVSAVWFILFGIVFSVILKRTRYGNWNFATGGNPEFARIAGVPSTRVKIINFTLCSILAGFAGVANLARFGMAQPTLGEGSELEAIAAAVVGGNLLTGGYGSIVGTFIGAIILGIIRTGLVMIGVTPFLYTALTGIVIIIAVVINESIRNGGRSA